MGGTPSGCLFSPTFWHQTGIKLEGWVHWKMWFCLYSEWYCDQRWTGEDLQIPEISGIQTESDDEGKSSIRRCAGLGNPVTLSNAQYIRSSSFQAPQKQETCCWLCQNLTKSMNASPANSQMLESRDASILNAEVWIPQRATRVLWTSNEHWKIAELVRGKPVLGAYY